VVSFDMLQQFEEYAVQAYYGSYDSVGLSILKANK